MSERDLSRKGSWLPRAIAVLASIVAVGIAFAAPAQATEPNDGFDTATGPLNAGQTLHGSLQTVNDADFQFFYIPDTTQVSVTTINDAAKTKGPSGKTIVSSLLRARKGRLPLPLVDTQRILRPGKRGTVEITLVPGKYFIPIGHAATKTAPQPNIPFRIKIGPIGSTTDSFEIFARRCNDALRKVSRIKSSKKNTAKRLAKAKRKDASPKKQRGLKQKLRSKRRKIDEAQRVKRIVCSVPQ